MDSPQLKSCPHCGNSLYVSIEYSGVYEKFFVRCPKCRMSGPLVEDKHAAAKAWNALPRRNEITPNDVDCAVCPERRWKE